MYLEGLDNNGSMKYPIRYRFVGEMDKDERRQILFPVSRGRPVVESIPTHTGAGSPGIPPLPTLRLGA